MQTFDLSRTSRHKITATIDKHYGGRVGFINAVKNGAVGIGKLKYLNGIDEVDRLKNKKMHFNANIEIYPLGIGVYAYNVDENYLTLIPTEEVRRFSISKPLDVIRPAEFSFFSKMQSWGIDYYKCRFMLLDHEIVEKHQVIINIELNEGSSVHMSIRKLHPYKHQEFFENNALNIKCSVAIQGHLELILKSK